MRFVILVVAIMALGACVTGMKGSARRHCYDSGLQPGTPEFSQCWKAIARRDTEEVLGAAAIVGAVAVAADGQSHHYGYDSSAPHGRRGVIARRDGNRCIYWTRQGERVMWPVNGICPMVYE